MKTPAQLELLGFTIQELAEILANFGEAPYRARQLFEALHRQRIESLEAISTLPKPLRARLAAEGYRGGIATIDRRFVSRDGTVRYLLCFSDGQTVETVWMPEGDGTEEGAAGESSNPVADAVGAPGAANGAESSPPAASPAHRRATICVSSQVGCAVNCKFCMTALLGVQRSLTAAEIVGQILTVLKDQQAEAGRDRINLVFMGQGEPFLNYDNFIRAVRLLVEGAGIPESRMTVSTSGIVPRIAALGAEPVRPHLAISLNAPNDPLREQIMPINRKWNLAALLDAARRFPLRPRERLTFEYVLLAGVNDREEHARELVGLLGGIRAKVNLIALNPGPEIAYETPSPAAVEAFQRILIAAGIPTYVRRPRGLDIYAACGQLKRTTELLDPGGLSAPGKI